ncbi:hypothetical protein PG994_002468 [Apiospora phragmitis]|uniref:Uncharacterized protein n=1 Tax=Apiospora phragmitis TaxID=2905665 RepID=A0ABR1WWF1_9PEZI
MGTSNLFSGFCATHDAMTYGLRDTPCWPSDLAKDDPGWTLLTNDEFYETQHPNLKQYRELYTKPPPLQDLKDALSRRSGKALYPASECNASQFKSFGFNKPKRKLYYIPDECLNVLPSLPFTGPVPLLKRGLSNATKDEVVEDYGLPEATAVKGGPAMVDIKKMTIENIHLTSDEDLEQMDDAQVDAWMERYMELLRKKSETCSNTSPPRVGCSAHSGWSGRPNSRGGICRVFGF